MTQLTEYLHSLEILDLITPEKNDPDSESVDICKPTLIEKAIYNSLLPPDRQQLHLQVGKALQNIYAASSVTNNQDSKQYESALLLAHHFEEGGDRQQAIKYLKQAAIQATTVYANKEAKDIYDHIMVLLEESNPNGQWNVLVARERVLDRLGQREHQAQNLALMQMLAELIGDKSRLAITYNRWAQYFNKINQYNLAVEVAELGLKMARQANDELLSAKSLNLLAETAWHCLDYQKAKNYAHQALESLHSFGSFTNQIDSLLHLGKVSYVSGQYNSALAYIQSAQEMASFSNNQDSQTACHFAFGWIYQGLGDYKQAEQQFQHALKKWLIQGDRYGQGVALSHLGWVAYDQQDYVKGMDYCQQALEIAQEVDDRENEAYSLTGLGLNYEQLGQWNSARAIYLQALTLHRSMGATTLATFDQIGLARAAVVQHNFTAALSYIQEVIELILDGKAQQFWNPWNIYLSAYRVLIAIGEDDTAQSILNEARTAIQQRGKEISDPKLRRCFLVDVKVNREIEEAWQACQVS